MLWILKRISNYGAWSLWEESFNEELDQELHKPVTKIFKRKKMHARLKVDIWAVDLCDMESLSTNQNIKYLLCVTDIFTKYTWIKPSKDK